MPKDILLLAITVIASFNLVGNCTAASADDLKTGEVLFNQNCSACHNFRQDGIGPQLGGIADQLSADSIRKFIVNPQQVIDANDERAVKLLEKYKVLMPSYSSLKDKELNAIIEFLQTQKMAVSQEVSESRAALTNPLPDPITFAGLVVDVEPIVQIPASSANGKLPLARINKLGFAPETGRNFVVDNRGKLYEVNLADGSTRTESAKPDVYLDLATHRPNFIQQPGFATGFGSFAFHPAFAKNGLFYTVHTEAPNSAKADFSFPDTIKVTLQSVITEWKATDPNASIFRGSSRELLRINMLSGVHGVQELVFNPHARLGDSDYGKLYIGVGEGGSAEEGFHLLIHGTDKIWGTVLRIDPAGDNSVNGKYGIPSDNPFIGQGNSLGEIYALGFRNPHRISWSKSGQMLVTNIGAANIESITLVAPGNDFGWPVREGDFAVNPAGSLRKVYPLPEDDAAHHFTYPIAEYDHDEGVAVSGGYEYQGAAIPSLQGKYLFGDIPTGRLFYFEMKDIKAGNRAPIYEWKMTIHGKPTSFGELFGSKRRVELHFGKDALGELYLLTKVDGQIYKLTSANMQ